MKRSKKKWISGLVAAMMISSSVSQVPVYARDEKVYEQEVTQNSRYQWADVGRYIEYPVNKLEVTASSTQAGYGPRLMLDKNVNTIWSSVWDAPYDNHVLNFTFEEPEFITGFMHNSRMDNAIHGTLEQYKIYISEDGINFKEEPTVQGNLEKKLGKSYIYFEEPILAKQIRIEAKVAAIAEFSFGYIPKEQVDYNELLKEAEELLEHVKTNEGLDAGGWMKGTYEAYRAKLEEIKAIEAEIHVKNRFLTQFIPELKYSKMTQVKELRDLYSLAKTMLNAAVIGELPLQYSEATIKEFDQFIKTIEPLAVANKVKEGEWADAKQAAQEHIIWFEHIANAPEIKVVGGSIKSGEIKDLIDGVTASRIQVNGGSNVITPENDNHYIELDYKRELQFENIVIKSWWATQQAPNKLKVQYEDNGEWKWVDSGKTYTLGWNTYQSQSEQQVVTFDKPVKGSKIRLHIDGANASFYGIDELKVGIGVDENEMKIVLDKEELQLEEGESYTLQPTILPNYATNKNIIWESSNPECVSVDKNGKVKALRVPGEEEIVKVIATTEYGKKQAECVIKITPKIVGEEERQQAKIRIDNARKLANASKLEDYTQEEIEAFKTKITEIEGNFENIQQIGEFNQTTEELKNLIEQYEQKSDRIEREARKLIDRITGIGSQENFIIEIIEKDDTTGQDVYEVDFDEGSQKVVLRGNNSVSVATAYNYYLKYYAFLDFPYTGDYKLKLPKQLPEVKEKVRIVFPYEYRHYANPCEYKYTLELYGVEDWQRRIDWMVMNGFNMYSMEMPADLIWYQASERLGLPETAKIEIRKSTNYQQYWGEYEISDEAYQLQIDKFHKVGQMSFDLGIEMEFKPYLGHISFMFPNNREDYYNKSIYKSEFIVDLPEVELLDGLRMYTGARWFNLPMGVYASSTIVEDNPMIEADMKNRFEQLGEIYYDTAMEILAFEEYGKVPKFVFSDVVGEQGFIVQHPAFPIEVLRDLEAELLKVNPDAIWLISSWRYYDWVNEVFTPGHIMWVDLEAEGGPKWNGTNEFGETQWIWSMLNNFGGNSGLSGGFDTIAQEVLKARDKAKYMKGIGITPEGGDTDPALYNLMAEMTWRSEAIDMEQWIKNYTKRRYGIENYESAQEELDKVWSGLYKTVYKQFVTEGPSQTLVAAHPRLTGAKARTWATNWKPYHTKELIEIWENLIIAGTKMEKPSEQFLYDLADITRQILADMSGDAYEKIAPAYQAKNKEEALKYADMMVEICKDMDKILNTRTEFLLGTRLNDSMNRGVTASDKAYYDKLEKTFLSYWILDDYNLGSGLVDYCNRHLAGLMTDYYGMRWQAFREELDRALSNNQSLDQGRIDEVIKENVVSWVDSGKGYATQINGKTVSVADELYDKYYPQMKELYNLTESSGDKKGLEDLWNANKDREQGEYTTASWEIFVKALEKAEQVLVDESVQSQVIIERTIKELNEAINGLVTKVEGYTIKVPESINGGKKFKVEVVINHTDKPIYAQDIMLAYDETLVDFIGVPEQENTIVVKTEKQKDGARVLLAHDKGITKEYTVELEFLAKQVNEANETSLGLVESGWGIVQDGESQVINVPRVEEKLVIVPGSEEVDKVQLEEKIQKAEQLLEEAQVGTEVGQYPEAAKKALEEVVVQAKVVLNNSQDQTEINEMVSVLQQAIEMFRSSQIQGQKEDVNQDNQVDVADLALIAYHYAKNSTDIDWDSVKKLDLNGDTKIDIGDLSLVANVILSK